MLNLNNAYLFLVTFSNTDFIQNKLPQENSCKRLNKLTVVFAWILPDICY